MRKNNRFFNVPTIIRPMTDTLFVSFLALLIRQIQPTQQSVMYSLRTLVIKLSSFTNMDLSTSLSTDQSLSNKTGVTR